VGFLVLIVLILLLFLGGNRDSKEDLSLIQARLTRLEARIKNTGALEDRIQQLEEQLMGVRQSLLKADRSIRSLKGDLAQLTEAFENSREKTTAVPQKVEVKKQAQEKKVSQPEKGYHIVNRGETLYRISKKYGISIDELRRLNSIEPYAIIHPGQKLLITSKPTE
jgi:LysM repeat protein